MATTMKPPVQGGQPYTGRFANDVGSVEGRRAIAHGASVVLSTDLGLLDRSAK